MTSLNRMMTFAALVPGALVLGGCANLGIHDTQSLLAPSLHRSEIVGFIAGFGTTFAAIPDRSRRSGVGRARASTRRWRASWRCFRLPWIYYGLLIVSRPVIVWNVVGVVTNSLTIWAYRSFARRERQETGGH